MEKYWSILSVVQIRHAIFISLETEEEFKRQEISIEHNSAGDFMFNLSPKNFMNKTSVV